MVSDVIASDTVFQGVTTLSLHLENLDERTRSFMLAEIEADLAASRLFISPRLSATGEADYPELLKQAVLQHNDIWLATQLRIGSRLNRHEQKRTPTGGMTLAKVPVNAPETLAEGEFNRFYIRALCLRAEQDGISELVIYRARYSEHPRAESEQKIGTRISASPLLNDLRSHPGVDTALGLPSVNSGLSVKLP